MSFDSLKRYSALVRPNHDVNIIFGRRSLYFGIALMKKTQFGCVVLFYDNIARTIKTPHVGRYRGTRKKENV